MLLEVAIGDAYGAGFEFAPAEFVEEFNTLENYVDNPNFQNNNVGKYTDDTQQSLAIAELLLQYDEWTPSIIADKFVEVYRRDPRAGYGRGSRMALKEATNGAEFLSLIHGTSDRCGAAMRAMPIGLLPNYWDVIEKAHTQAAVTHNSDEGITSAVVSALMTHYFAYQLGSKYQLPQFLLNDNDGPWHGPFKGDIVGTGGFECVSAALTMIMKHDNTADILKGCVALTGDVDSVAAIALGAASTSNIFEQNLPQHLIDNLENDNYGKDYTIALDKKIQERFQWMI